MSTIEKTIEVKQPASTVYDQWTRCEEFPQFMKGIKEVSRIDDKNLRWNAAIGGKAKDWDAEIIEQVPNRRIGWRSTRGAANSGTVTFVPLTPAKTRVILYLNYEPDGLFEKLGDNLGLVSTRVAGDLNRFKDFVETRSSLVKNQLITTAAASATP